MPDLSTLSVLIASIFVLIGFRIFERVATDVGPWLARSSVLGAGSGFAFRIADESAGRLPAIALTAIVLSLAAIAVTRRDVTSGSTNGLMTGAMIGISAALIVTVWPSVPALPSSLVIVASIAGLGSTLIDRRNGRVAFVMGLGVVGVSSVSMIAALELIGDRSSTLVPAIAMILAAAVGSIFERSRTVQAELREEVELGFVERKEVAAITSPLRRFRNRAWHDRRAWQRFVQVSTDLAIQKRRQRSMAPAAARLYQLDVLRLRMLLGEIRQVERAVSEETARRQSSSDLTIEEASTLQ